MNMRQFIVLVERKGRKTLAYPLQSGVKSLKSMKKLSNNGHVVFAETLANGITEVLTIDDMISIFDENK